MVKELLKNDVFIVTIGYNAVAYAKAGFMIQEATKTYAEEKLCSVLKTIGEAGDLKNQSYLGRSSNFGYYD